MRRPPERSWLGVGAALAALALGWPGVGGGAHVERASGEHRYPWKKRLEAAERFADRRAGKISFAVVDEGGTLRGKHEDRVHHSASVVKVMFMVALLREPDVRKARLARSERRLLRPMIRRSDNDTATAIYNRVGERALYDLAREAKMRQFTTQPLWGLSTITAAEQARFMYRIERYIPKRHRIFAKRLLTEIVDRQRWGIPPEAPRGWTLHFKGGWSGKPNWRVNQVMLLRKPPRRFAVAILTRDQPTKNYGEQSIRGVAKRLLRGYNKRTR